MSDYLDHVDDNDVVIGRITRKEAHEKDLLHRSVHILVMNSNDQILMHQVGRHKRTYQLHMHTSAAGHVDSGDTYETAAHKELQEELGIENATLEFIGKFRQSGLDHEICGLYLAYHDGPYTNWETEAETISFYTIPELDRLITDQPHIFTPTFKSAYALFCEKKGCLEAA